MKLTIIAAMLFALVGCTSNEISATSRAVDDQQVIKRNSLVSVYPANKAAKINPDTHLVLTFTRPPTIGTSGLIRIYDAADNTLVDTLDMSIPVSPRPLGRAPPRVPGDVNSGPGPADPNDKTIYQANIVGGIDFHFFPIIVHGNVATIYPHNNVLKYGHTYIVRMDASALKLTGDAFAGFTENAWMFTTKNSAPPANAKRIVVAADGSGDFNTVQGAIDFVPAKPAKRVTVFIKSGNYEEIVFLCNKADITVRGEHRDKVQVGYSNNSAFNPSKSGPSRRPAFSIINSNDIQLSNFTVNNYFIGQAEALLIRGERNIIDHMTLNGSGDAFTTYGTIYMQDRRARHSQESCRRGR